MRSRCSKLGSMAVAAMTLSMLPGAALDDLTSPRDYSRPIFNQTLRRLRG